MNKESAIHLFLSVNTFLGFERTLLERVGCQLAAFQKSSVQSRDISRPIGIKKESKIQDRLVHKLIVFKSFVSSKGFSFKQLRFLYNMKGKIR
jgi:hypothetical protein